MVNRIKQLKAGAEKAFKSIFDEYHQKVFFVCRQMGLRVEDAEDVVQETFFQLWKQRQGIDEEKNIVGLIQIIAKRLVIKKMEQQKKVEILNESITTKSSEEKGNRLNESPISQALQKLINELPEGRRKMLNMYYHEGLSVKEISLALDLSPRTVENQLYRAKKVLKNQLNQEGFSSLFSWLLLILWLLE